MNFQYLFGQCFQNKVVCQKQRNKDVPNIDKLFSNWAYQAKEMYKLCKDNKIKLNEFNKWLKDHQDWINKQEG